MAEFVRAMALADLPSEGCVPLTVQGVPLLIGQDHGRIFACVDKCPHAGAPLHLGTLIGTELQCARHGWRFDVLTAQSLPEPSAFQLTRIPVKVQGQDILVAPSL